MQDKSTLRLAYVSSMAIGGLEGYNYRELLEMEKLGADVSVFITKFKPGPYMPPRTMALSIGAPLPVLKAQPMAFLRAPLTYLRLLGEALVSRTVVDFLIAQKWSDEMKRSGRNWIHCHWGDHKLFIGYYCHRLLGIPLSVTMHGYDLYANPNWGMLEKSLKVCSQIVTISNNNREILIRKFGDLGRRVKVIRLFADVSEPDDENLVRILIVGGFLPRKGHDVLLDAIKSLKRKDLHLWVVGYKGPVDVKALVKKAGIEDQVTFFGQVSDDVLHVLYTFCDVFCLPARFGPDGIGEGLPVALMEAMAFRKPIVSTYHTGIPELVPEILVKENDVEGLAAALAKYADDKELRKRQGKLNREIIERDYSPENVKRLLDALVIE